MHYSTDALVLGSQAQAQINGQAQAERDTGHLGTGIGALAALGLLYLAVTFLSDVPAGGSDATDEAPERRRRRRSRRYSAVK